MNIQLESIIRNAYDLHVHIGPEAIPRRYVDAESLASDLNGRLAGVALKNHFFPTISMMNQKKSSKIKLVGSVVLNNFVGGLNADAIYAASTLGLTPFIVWFPTVSAKQFLDTSKWEVAPEWVDKRKGFMARKAKCVQRIKITDANNRLTKNCMSVLQAIKKTNAILATGHISWQESLALVKEATTMGIRKITVTHPIYERIAMPISIQRKLALMGAKIEHCWSMWAIDKVPIERIARQIREIGPRYCIISSDSGQSFSPRPDQALFQFCNALADQGITMKEINLMCVTNPKALLSK